MTTYNLKLSRTLDAELIRDFMIKPEIWDCFADDMSDKDQYHPSITSRTMWLSVMDNDDLVGLVLLENVNLNTLDVHPAMLRSHRKHIMAVFDDVFKIFLTFPDYINKLVATIPFCRKIVYNTAIHKGFVEEGISRESYLKNGIFYDQWNLGLTRAEIRGLIWLN